MKSKILLIVFLITSSILTSCSKDEDAALPIVPITNDVLVTIDEYPRSGHIISALTTNLTGEVSYSIISQSTNSALIIINTDLTVGDWLAFDFETNPVITATVAATNGEQSETIDVIVTVNNVDDIWSFLGDASKVAYENAADGQWIQVTAAEYNDLANYLSEVTKVGATDAHLNLNTTKYYDPSVYTYANDNGITVPASSYVFAFKYECDENAQANTKVKLSNTSVNDGFEDLGNAVPVHNNGVNYFVLKGSNTPTPNASYLGVRADNFGYYSGNTGYSFKYNSDDEAMLPYNWTGVALYQGLSTTLKQW